MYTVAAGIERGAICLCIVAEPTGGWKAVRSVVCASSMALASVYELRYKLIEAYAPRDPARRD
jgi:hypothetical protein